MYRNLCYTSPSPATPPLFLISKSPSLYTSFCTCTTTRLNLYEYQLPSAACRVLENICTPPPIPQHPCQLPKSISLQTHKDTLPVANTKQEGEEKVSAIKSKRKLLHAWRNGVCQGNLEIPGNTTNSPTTNLTNFTDKSPRGR